MIWRHHQLENAAPDEPFIIIPSPLKKVKINPILLDKGYLCQVFCGIIERCGVALNSNLAECGTLALGQLLGKNGYPAWNIPLN